MVVKPVSGGMYDRYGLRVSLLTLAVVSGCALIVLPLLDEIVTLTLVTVCIAPITGGGTIAQSYLIDGLAGDIRGTGLGIVRTITVAVAAITPVAFGAMAEQGFFDGIFYSLVVLTGLMALFVVSVPESAT
jgi:MFS family permease